MRNQAVHGGLADYGDCEGRGPRILVRQNPAIPSPMRDDCQSLRNPLAGWTAEPRLCIAGGFGGVEGGGEALGLIEACEEEKGGSLR